ncbi:MAG: hypothetical protein A2V50_02290 [Bacteroidetes bacterium RBG_19FT_COMBO_42_10]|nr:MAG: hypothetical protein A2V50_02290 [Bacteroidetes bacterium RBG_19FT_COMBO_42_10]
MKIKSFSCFLLLLFISISIPAFSQENTIAGDHFVLMMDSLRRSGVILNDQQEIPEIKLSAGEAIEYLRQRYQPECWKNTSDPLRLAIGQLIYEASYPPYDSSQYFLEKYPFDSINIPWDKFYIWEPLRLKVPEVTKPAQPDSIQVTDTLPAVAAVDTVRMQIPEPVAVAGFKDTSVLVVIDTLHEVSSERVGFPFTWYNYPFQGDSIRAAVRILMDFVEARDSSIIKITGLGEAVTHIWLNSRSDVMKRYWLKNEMDDSITVWIGSPSRNTLGLYLEQGVNFRRPVKQGYYSDARIEIKEVDKSTLLDVKTIPVKIQYWKFRSEASFALNQGAISNWVKGGESSVSTTLDITGYADYNNKALKMTSGNFARLKYGLIKIGDNDIRKNIDLLETNSKLNHKAFGKFDFSAIMLFKTQLASGFSYPNDTTRILVSKFFNPAILTVGLGLDYKPNKNTSINFSPLSYKGTFVTDTTGVVGVDAIDETKYGIPAGKKAKNEPGMSFMITNVYKPVSTVTITNRLQLFTNYINNPQNIDVDWEMIVTAALNWFTDVRFNTHLIFDDDTKTPVFDKEKQPVPGHDGKQKTTARIQFKELLGFSFVFRF